MGARPQDLTVLKEVDRRHAYSLITAWSFLRRRRADPNRDPNAGKNRWIQADTVDRPPSRKHSKWAENVGYQRFPPLIVSSHAGGHWFESSSLHQIPPHLRWDFSLPKFLPDSGSMAYTRVRKQALCVLETDRRASVRTGAAMTSFSVFADTTSYFSSSCASVTRPLTPTPMYTTCRATSPDILRLSRVPIHSPASMHTMLTPATGSSSARK